MDQPRCTQCGCSDLEPGFVNESTEGWGYARWIAGALERGIFGGARRMGRSRRLIDAYRCTACGHLELFATRPE